MLSRVWAKRNTRPQQIKQIEFESCYIFGAVNPLNGERSGLIFSVVDSEVFNIHLELISASVSENSHVVLILDNAGFHKSKKIKVPANMTLLNLPPYSPELNPVERLWHWIKSHYLANRVYKNLEELKAAASEAWNKLTKEIICSVCKVDWILRMN